MILFPRFRQFSIRQWVLLILGLLAILATYFVLSDHITPNTSDAYLQAYVSQMAPQVDGRVVDIYVQNNTFAKKGTPLFKVDPRIYKHQASLFSAELVTATQQVKALKAQIVQADESIKQHQANFKYAKIFYNDMRVLAREDAVPILNMQQALDGLRVAQERVEQAYTEKVRLQETLGPVIKGEYAIINIAKANLATAKLKLSETIVYAPSDGFVTNMSLFKGAYASIGTPVITFIATNEWWIVANIKENNLSRIKAGQSVDVAISNYPGMTFTGEVESIGYGVNLTPAVAPNYLPFIQKTANWVDLAQRFPVRIKLIDFDAYKYPLRVGSTTYVTIYTDKLGFIHGISYLVHRIISYWQYVS